MDQEKLTQEAVQRMFDYKEGKLFWKVRPCNKAKIGCEAGMNGNNGYRMIVINGVKYLTHRLIYLYHCGYFPEKWIDHINRNRMDNRIENLREVSPTCNLRNAGNRKDNKSGIKGVSFIKNRNLWLACIQVSGKTIHLGCPECFLEAVCLRLAGEQALNWSRCDNNSPAFQYVKSKIPWIK